MNIMGLNVWIYLWLVLLSPEMYHLHTVIKELGSCHLVDIIAFPCKLHVLLFEEKKIHGTLNNYFML